MLAAVCFDMSASVLTVCCAPLPQLAPHMHAHSLLFLLQVQRRIEIAVEGKELAGLRYFARKKRAAFLNTFSRLLGNPFGEKPDWEYVPEVRSAP